MAKYEYENDVANEKSGTIESFEQKEKDRILITIDDTKYTIILGDAEANSFEIGVDIDQGDYVHFKYGKESKVIFSIAVCADKGDTDMK